MRWNSYHSHHPEESKSSGIGQWEGQEVLGEKKKEQWNCQAQQGDQADQGLSNETQVDCSGGSEQRFEFREKHFEKREQRFENRAGHSQAEAGSIWATDLNTLPPSSSHIEYSFVLVAAAPSVSAC
jgi:hypothetical protein